MTKFKQVLIGSLDTQNGTFTIIQTKRGGTCRITDQNGNHSYAGSIPKAWCNARYQAGITFKTHNSSGWTGR